MLPELALDVYFSEGSVDDDVFDPETLANGFEPNPHASRPLYTYF